MIIKTKELPPRDHNMPITFSETFYSIQGEGYFTGVPSTWVRFFLCNLQCSGFGQDDPTDVDNWELPYKDFDANSIKDVTELPVWEKGCDSSYSWAKKFRHLQKHETAKQIVDTMLTALYHTKKARFVKSDSFRALGAGKTNKKKFIEETLANEMADTKDSIMTILKIAKEDEDPPEEPPGTRFLSIGF